MQAPAIYLHICGERMKRMKVSMQEVELVAHQSQLILSEDEKKRAVQDLTCILEYADKLSELNTDNVEPTVQVLPIADVFREDEICPSMDREIILKNAPHATDDSFIVPKIVE